MRGFDQEDVREVGRIIVDALAPSADLDALAARSAELCRRRPLYPGKGAFPTFGGRSAQ
jgi:hypothetical protein